MRRTRLYQTNASACALKSCFIILNTDNYYDPLLDMLDRTAQRHFMNPVFKKLWAVAKTPEEAIRLVDTLPDWNDTTSKINTNK